MKAVSIEQRLHGGERVVEDVLVVDRIESAALDQIAQVWKFELRDPVILEENGESLDEGVYSLDMSQNVVGENDVCLLAFADQRLRGLSVEERIERRNSSGTRGLRRPLRRIDAENRHSGCDEVFQQVAIVARYFDDKAVRAQIARFDQSLSVMTAMEEQCWNERRKVRVVLSEENVWIDRFGDLHQRAVLAKSDLEWEPILGLVLSRSLYERVSDRL
jgi:hypothetical protein